MEPTTTQADPSVTNTPDQIETPPLETEGITSNARLEERMERLSNYDTYS